MEKRVILAIALSAAILILYQLLFMPSPQAPRESPKADVSETKPADTTPPPPLPAPPVVSTPAPVPARQVQVDTPRFRAMVTTAGGRIVDWVMKYRGERSVVPRESPPPFGATVERTGGQEPSELKFEARTGNVILSSAQREGVLRLEGVDQYQLALTTEFRFNVDNDWTEIVFRLENRHRVPQQVELSVGWAVPPQVTQGATDRAVHFTRVVWLNSSGLFRYPTQTLSDRRVKDGARWIALESDDHYLAALIPKSPQVRSVEEGGPGRPARIGLLFTPVILAPGGRAEVEMALYIGPKEYDRLREMGVGLEKSVDFGTLFWILPMEWFSVPILWVMNIIYRYTGNYGIAIILLTVLTKIIFYPLTQKSMTSMKRMQALQPQMNALRAKYKNDKQRVQQEMMELYRKHGVNPMGGCLPIVIQIPIFYALYVTLTVSVELQQSPLLCLGEAPTWVPLLGGKDLWICDLARKDPTLLLPLLMGASMFIQQKMTPTVGDPRQAKIMLVLPVIFTFTFLEFPAGLVLYWLVNNILSIAQQVYINRESKRIEAPVKDAGRRSTEGKKE